MWCAALSFTGQEHNPWARLSSQAANANPLLERTSNRDSFSQHHLPRASISQNVLQHVRTYIFTAGKKHCVKLKTSLFKNSLWCIWSFIWPIRPIKILSDNCFPQSIRARQDHASLTFYQYFSWLKTDTQISLQVICEANLCLRLWSKWRKPEVIPLGKGWKLLLEVYISQQQGQLKRGWPWPLVLAELGTVWMLTVHRQNLPKSLPRCTAGIYRPRRITAVFDREQWP